MARSDNSHGPATYIQIKNQTHLTQLLIFRPVLVTLNEERIAYRTRKKNQLERWLRAPNRKLIECS